MKKKKKSISGNFESKFILQERYCMDVALPHLNCITERSHASKHIF